MSTSLQSSDPSYRQFAKILERQKTTTKNAYLRKGEQPKDHPPRWMVVEQFNMVALASKMDAASIGTGGSMMRSTVIGNPYPPCIASLNDLKKIMIKDLNLETNHRGSYLLLRFLCPALRMTAIQNIVEDEAGTAVLFSLYMQEPESVRSADSVLKHEAAIILKEPYFKVATNGQYSLRVDQPSDMVCLPDDDVRIPHDWKVLGGKTLRTAEYWKRLGNDLVNTGRFFEAIEQFSRALRSSPTPEEEIILHNNRAHANLQIEAFDAALADVSFVPSPLDRSLKGIYRGGLALYGLGRFKEAVGDLQILVHKYPESVAGKQALDRSRLRLEEQEVGAYDFGAMYKYAKRRPPLMDNANFKGPIEVRESHGRGRGLFATSDVKAGDLILCEKAFSYCHAAAPGDTERTSKGPSNITILLDIPENRISLGTQVDLIRNITNKLARNPSLAPSFEDLHHGNYEGVLGATSDGTRVVDTFLVAKIARLNSFGCPLTTKSMAKDPPPSRASIYTDTQTCTDEAHQTSGLRILASYINHSCDVTCKRSFIGDMQIVRAARDLPANTELAFSYIDRADSTKMNETLYQNWGFRCCCVICVDDRELSSATKQQRAKLTRVFDMPSTSTNRRKGIIQKLELTYQQSSSEVPRLLLWDLHSRLVDEFVRSTKIDLLVDQVLAMFESVGFVIQGAKIFPVTLPRRITIQKWGFPHPGATSAWLTLRDAYKVRGEVELADQAHQFARITWSIFVGEDTSFAY